MGEGKINLNTTAGLLDQREIFRSLVEDFRSLELIDVDKVELLRSSVREAVLRGEEFEAMRFVVELQKHSSYTGKISKEDLVQIEEDFHSALKLYEKSEKALVEDRIYKAIHSGIAYVGLDDTKDDAFAIEELGKKKLLGDSEGEQSAREVLFESIEKTGINNGLVLNLSADPEFGGPQVLYNKCKDSVERDLMASGLAYIFEKEAGYESRRREDQAMIRKLGGSEFVFVVSKKKKLNPAKKLEISNKAPMFGLLEMILDSEREGMELNDILPFVLEELDLAVKNAEYVRLRYFAVLLNKRSDSSLVRQLLFEITKRYNLPVS